MHADILAPVYHMLGGVLHTPPPKKLILWVSSHYKILDLPLQSYLIHCVYLCCQTKIDSLASLFENLKKNSDGLYRNPRKSPSMHFCMCSYADCSILLSLPICEDALNHHDIILWSVNNACVRTHFSSNFLITSRPHLQGWGITILAEWVWEDSKHESDC